MIGAAIFLLGFAGEVRSGLNGDSAWLLHVAGRVLDGARLYVDVVEVNPPLVVWLNLPIVALARAADLPPAALYRAVVWATAFLTLWLANRSLRRLAPALRRRRRYAMLLGIAVVLLGIPGAYFGQREHLALILVLPWLLLVGARLEGAVAPAAEAAAAGAMAAVGTALKPHFLLLPLMVAGWAWARTPRPARRLPPDIAALAAVFGAYGLSVVVLEPEYFRLVSRLSGVYWDYLRRPLTTVLAGDLRPLTVVWALCYWPLARRLTRHEGLADLLGVATAALFAAVVLQHKGFGYHYYPALGTGLLLVLLGLLGGGARLPSPPVRIAAQGVGLLVLLPVLALFLGWTVRRAGGSARVGPVAAGSREIGAWLAGAAPRGPVAIYSPWMEDSFPLVLERGLEWGSRYPFVWFLPAFQRVGPDGREPVACPPEAEMPPLERELIGSVAEDLRERRPGLVFIRKPGRKGLLRVPILACFSQVEAFRQAFGAYHHVQDLEHFQVYQRHSDT